MADTQQAAATDGASFFTRAVRSSRYRVAKLLLKGSLNLFDSMVDDYWSTIRTDPRIAPNANHFDALQRDGICIVPNYASNTDLLAIRAEIASIQGFQDGSYVGPRSFS